MVKTTMRQSVDGVTQIVERQSPGAYDAAAGLRAKFYWSDALVWFMRAIAWLWVAKGLFNWGLVLGAFARYGDFALLSRSLQGAIVFFAAVDLLAAIGLWLAAPWGGVLWLLCVSIETVSPALGVRGAGSGALGAGLNVVLVALYFFLTWRAGQERT